MTCKLPAAEAGEYRIARDDLRRVEWAQLEEMVRSSTKPEPDDAHEVLILMLATSELASQAATQLSPRERRLFCSLAADGRPANPLGAALATVLMQRFRSGARRARPS